MDHILLQELSDAKKRMETLEQYNATLVQRCSQLEHQSMSWKRTNTELTQAISHLELEKKMAHMQVDQMTKQLQYQQSSLDEMQLEIDLLQQQQQSSTIQQQQAVNRSQQHSNHPHSKNNPQQQQQLIQHLQEKVQALEEWAVASNHAKAIANDRIHLLEEQLYYATVTTATTNANHTSSMITDVSVRSTSSNSRPPNVPPTSWDHNNSNTNNKDIQNSNNQNENLTMSSSMNISGGDGGERVLDTRKASLVIGAGDVGVVVFALNPEQFKTFNHFTQRIVLRWRFDILQGPDADITFGVWKGSCLTAAERKNTSDAIISKRHVKGGAGGEIDHAFSVRQSCTMAWSNEHSWVRPRTIKYIFEAILMDD